jgi:hypothetical protein
MILDYTTHVNVADGHDAVDKIRAYAVSKGWVQQDWRSNTSWIGTANPYSFGALAGCCYLCLTSTGYGTTPLIARMGIFPGKVGNASSGKDYFYLAMASSTTVDYTTPMYPWAQYSITNPEVRASTAYGSVGMDLGVSTIQKMWIFGNSKWIMAVLNYDGSHVCALHFGQMEMIESNPSQGQCKGISNLYWSSFTGRYPMVYSHYLEGGPYSSTAIGNPWIPRSVGPLNSGYIITSLDFAYSDNNAVPYSNQGASTSFTCRIAQNVMTWCADPISTKCKFWSYDCASYHNSGLYTSFPDLSMALNVNTYSNRRVMIKPVYAIQSRIDSTYRPICRCNVYLTRFDGFTIGQQVSYGTEQYLMFPIWHISEPVGFAVRIA